ncbi:hypothetical protein PHYSODRAFT_533584 [Phytophthora sojae]|uniref:Tyr recombinase domain-containing protein n=1 Tax=Phytophthora sojae (strain P6497) TaxID=1094619 RepID=G5AG96_PHYSP|nr:hypothetical protein PHYSODRAFT_533584 [Phytophthora sojae]EGZ05608.1 hypothetical protein PHYSODRAFT_533584 [Phytophthora sojae]|eukprot:XP_009539139.1 hypothetical protein PHYSODRAFT_533584 [Phytophthora sojae]
MGWHTWLPDSGRASSNKLIYFAIYLWKYGGNNARRGNHHNTIQSKLSSVIWYHRRYCGLQLRQSPQMTILRQGIKRMSDPVRKKQPVTPAFLHLLRRSLNFTQPRDRLLWGSVLIGYFFLLRRSEYLAIGKRRSFYCLQTKDVSFADSNGNQVTASSASAITIGLRGAKNDQYGRGSRRTMHQSGDRSLCPVRALKHILRARRDLNAVQHKYLCAELDTKTVATVIKRTARKAGVPESNYSTHSLRSGGASALLAGKADGLAIKLLRRWMSRCFEEYPVQSAKSTRDLAKRMI